MDFETISQIANIVMAGFIILAPMAAFILWGLARRRRNESVREVYDQLQEWEDILEKDEDQLFKKIEDEKMPREAATMALLMQIESRLTELHAILMTDFTYKHMRPHEVPKWLKSLEVRLLKSKREWADRT